MVPSVRQLVEQLGEGDFDTRARAVEQLMHRGREATPALVEALKHEDRTVRALAAEALASIRDPASADSLFAALNDSDGEVRAQAAGALTRMDDPRAIPALIRTIDDFEDILHAPYTLSAYHLIAYGQEALPAVAPLLEAEYPMTRMRAAAIIRDVISRMDGGGKYREEVKELLEKYDPTGPDDERREAAKRLAKWIEQNVERQGQSDR